MMKKKITYKAVAYGTVGLAMIGSSFLVNALTNHRANSSVQLNDVSKLTSINRETNGQVLNTSGNTANNQEFIIRSNPSNGFNGLTSPDGKYTYVLITKKTQEAITPVNVGGYNSGIACIDNTTGNLVGQPWYLPIGYAFKDNYTTNIVFGQTERGEFDSSKLFVLCGISNLADAINTVYTGYDANAHILKTELDKSPTIKIFSLSVTSPGIFTNTLGLNAFYNFAYPSDGKNGYAGFNNDGAYYQVSAQSGSSFDHAPIPRSFEKTNYMAWDVKFEAYNKTYAPNGIKRTNPVWEKGESFKPLYYSAIGAFNSYLTYLTYGQNFAYHFNTSYRNSDDKTIHQDEFLMSTAFVNVDQNLGGLYSAFVNYRDWGSDVDFLGNYVHPVSKAQEQKDWPIPFGYEYLLASLANEAKVTNHQNPQYTYVSADGTKHPVNWGSSLALSQPIIDFFNDNLFIHYVHNADYPLGSLFDRFTTDDYSTGASWGVTTGYVIFNPKTSTTVPKSFTKDNINEYRYYYIAELTDRPFSDSKSSIEMRRYINQSLTPHDDTAFYLQFTNLLATNQLSPNGGISYLINISWERGDNTNAPLSSFGNLTISSMFCYDWNSLSNDNQDNAMIEPLASQANTISYGYYNGYLKDEKEGNMEVKPSFQNWNLVFLGAPSQEGINQMDSSFTADYESFSINGKLRDYYSWEQALGIRLTYLRRKISFVVFPYNGFVYFTSGTTLNWQTGFSIWDVRGNDYLSLYHDYGRTNNVYLTNPANLLWRNSDDAIWGIKEVNKQPWGNGGKTLLFITSKGVYSIAGTSTTNYIGSVTNVLAEGGMNPSNWFFSKNPSLLNDISYTAFPAFDTTTNDNTASSYGTTIPNVTVFDTNFLSISKQNQTFIYSVQQNTDYLTNKVVDDRDLPKALKGIPAAKPLLPVDHVTSINGANIRPNLKNAKGNTLTFLDLMKIPLANFFRNVLGLSSITLPYGCAVNANYDAGLNGFFIESADPVNNIKAKIAIPVTYNTKLDQINSEITYFAPIIQDDQSYELSYLLSGLEKVDYTRPVIILNDTYGIVNELNEKKLTAAQIVNQYGSDTYDPDVADAFIDIFVDKTATDTYISQHDYLKGLKYWLWPVLTSDGKLGIWVKYKLPSVGINDWTISQDGIQSGICLYVNFVDGQPHNLQSTYSFEGYIPLVKFNADKGLNAKLIIGTTIAALCAIAVILGLGIGLPMRKQHRINILRAKITNKRIDKLSSSVSHSIRRIAQTTAYIGKDISQLKDVVRHSLRPARTQRVPTSNYSTSQTAPYSSKSVSATRPVNHQTGPTRTTNHY